MASNEETQGSSSSSIDEPPLWDYVEKLDKQGSGGTWKFKCKICGENRQGSYSRVRAHLLGIKGSGIAICKKATQGDKVAMKKLEDAYEEKKNNSKEKEVGLPCEAGNPFKKRKPALNPIQKAFGVEIRDQLDEEIARMFYTGGLPFNLARNPHYHRAFQFAAENKIEGYVPPNYNKLRTTLLQKEKENVHKLLEPIRLSWKERGVSIVSDGWSTYAFIHSLRRNRLTTSRAQDLVYVHNNLRLLSRAPNDDLKMWDIGGDTFDSMEDVGFLQFADLSLDEPDLENGLINNN